MKVCIAEKPSVAREIANILGAKTKRDGYFEGNNYAVTYTFGHLCTLLEPKDYKPHWKNWDLNNLPMLPKRFETKVNGDKGIQKQFQIVKSLFDKAEEVINCGDAGQEGELIQRWVINQCNYKGPVKRLWISSLTEEAIKEGFKNLELADKYNNLYYAGYSRAIGDWLLGLNATRLYTIKYGSYQQVLSIGRVQTPTLAMLVNRYKEIKNFRPETYWELQTTYKNTVFNCEEGRFFNKNDGEILANKVAQSDFTVTSIKKKKAKDYAPKLFDLTGLQVYCNTKFGFSADETLKIVQKLYEMKLVTYPRVDTTFLPSDIYPKISGILKRLTAFTELTTPLLNKKIKKSKRVFDDKKVTDHHAIIPTGVQTKLQINQEKVYHVIVKRFIAVFYPESEVSNTTILGEAAKVFFKTTGKEIITKGWRKVFEFHNNNASKTNQKEILPEFIKGEKGPHQPSFEEKETKPPRNYTEASLLRAMETAGKQVDDDEMGELMKENGIGRPSTRASIIETLFRRKYIERKKKLVIPTQTGIDLIDLIDNDLLKSAELTGRWEKQLKEIERGNFHASTFINNMKKMVDDLVYEVRSNKNTKRLSAVKEKTKKTANTTKVKKNIVGKKCPKCKTGVLVKGKTAYGCSDYNKNCNVIIPFKIFEKKISETQILRLIDKKATTNLKGFLQNDKKVEGSLYFDENYIIQLKQKESNQKKENLICPKCNSAKIIKGKTAYGCSNYNNGCDFIYPFSKIKENAKGKTITESLVLELIYKS